MLVLLGRVGTRGCEFGICFVFLAVLIRDELYMKREGDKAYVMAMSVSACDEENL